MEVRAVMVTDGAAPMLEVAAPGVAARVSVDSVGGDVTPTVYRYDGGKPLVVAKGAEKAAVVGWGAVASHVPCSTAAEHRGQPRGVEFQNFVEALDIGRLAVFVEMMCPAGRDLKTAPTHALPPVGLRMLQLRQSARLRYVAMSSR